MKILILMKADFRQPLDCKRMYFVVSQWPGQIKVVMRCEIAKLSEVEITHYSSPPILHERLHSPCREAAAAADSRLVGRQYTAAPCLCRTAEHPFLRVCGEPPA